jgi:hypothetical protein
MIRNSFFVVAIFTVLVILASSCQAATVNVNITESTQFVDLATIDLTTYDDFALWGASPSGNLLRAEYAGEGPVFLINRTMADLTNGNPVRSMGQFAWHEPSYRVSESLATNAGLQHYPIPNSPVGEGFRMELFPSASADTVYSVFGTAYGGPTRILVGGANYTPQMLFTSEGVRWKADFTVGAGGDPLLLQFQLASITNTERAPDANVTVSAVGAEVFAVPEPETMTMAFLAALPLLAIPKRRKV